MKRVFRSYAVISIIIAAAVYGSSCKQLDVFEKNVSIPEHKWKYEFSPVFNFDIADTVAHYNIFVVLRHTDAYRYNNIWLNINGIYNGRDTLLKIPRIEMPLGTDKGWEGTGMDDIWEIRKQLTPQPVHFSKPGSYQFSVAQIMRENPLPNILSVGLRVEKVK